MKRKEVVSSQGKWESKLADAMSYRRLNEFIEDVKW